jgi:outer membrane protein assembly factor BamB
VTLADLDGDERPEVLWGDSGTTEFHVADAQGRDVWSRVIGEVLDAPEAIGDVNGDGALDIVLASCGSGESGRPGLRAFDGMSGDVLWRAEVGGCYQSAPLLFDQDGDGLLDVVVSTWFDEKVRAFSGRDGKLRWETPIAGWTYHAGSFGDLDGDDVPDIALGDYSGALWAIDGADGEVLWSRKLPGETYVFGPTGMGDLDGDGGIEIVVAANALHIYGADGARRFGVQLPAPSLRGPALTDLDGDTLPDIVVTVDTPGVRGYSGLNGAVRFTRDFPEAGEAGFQPTIADLDGDGGNDVFLVYGIGRSDEPQSNWGHAVALPLGGAGKAWPTYSHDHHHSGNHEYPVGAAVNEPGGAIPDGRRAYMPSVRR